MDQMTICNEKGVACSDGPTKSYNSTAVPLRFVSILGSLSFLFLFLLPTDLLFWFSLSILMILFPHQQQGIENKVSNSQLRDSFFSQELVETKPRAKRESISDLHEAGGRKHEMNDNTKIGIYECCLCCFPPQKKQLT